MMYNMNKRKELKAQMFVYKCKFFFNNNVFDQLLKKIKPYLNIGVHFHR